MQDRYGYLCLLEFCCFHTDTRRTCFNLSDITLNTRSFEGPPIGRAPAQFCLALLLVCADGYSQIGVTQCSATAIKHHGVSMDSVLLLMTSVPNATVHSHIS